MAYIALYRKWRPTCFEDVAGQSHITKTLQKAIDTDKVAHAYLFSGPRGTGKTSTAKIFARAMNCVRGPTSHPCNECEVCRHIMSGDSLDVVEIDAASNRSIEDIRTLRETIKFMPAEGHKKVYIIDEVHMLTTEAFNALLKTLEEPPAHVIFILATTEPERIPMTILSRCQRYEFRRITSRDIAERMEYIAGQEHIDITRGAVHILSVQADGGMRDALSMLDQCVSNADGKIDEALVRNLLGLIGKDWLFAMADAVFSGAGDVIIKSIDDIIRMGKDPVVILTEFLEHLRAIMLYQAAPESDTLSAYADCMKELAAQAKKVTVSSVFRLLPVIQQALLTAKTSPVPRVAVEMGLLMASRTAGASMNEPLASVPDSILEQTARQKSQEITVYDEPIPGDVIQQQERRTVTEERPKEALAAKIPAQPAKKSALPTQPTAAKSVNAAQYRPIWEQVCQILDKERKKAVLSCVRNGRIVYLGAGQAIVAFKTAFMVKRANREDYYTLVDAALQSVLGVPCHMQAFLEGDGELLAYERKQAGETKRAENDVQQVHESFQAVPAEAFSEAKSEKAAPAPAESPELLQPASVGDMTPEEHAVLEPLLKTVGDCNIYMENKS